ncbi:MAG: NAD(P)/FAD-dependent oxidoreductase [bacterium]
MSFASSNTFDVAIAGAGPAGTSAAIRLALHGARVLLVEEKKFPRAKLCGEFISPECLAHFHKLGVLDQMTAAGGSSLGETVFYSARGHKVAVPSEWFTSGANALGLSRSEMDHRLLERAGALGVTVLEDAHAVPLTFENNFVLGLKVKTSKAVDDHGARVTIDATGRTRALARHFDREQIDSRKRKPGLVAFKAHLENTRVTPGACEIYFYPGGYGGLSQIEGGLSNLCFIVSASDVRRCGSVPDRVLCEVVMRNARAAETLRDAKLHSAWLSVSLEGFGRKTLTPAHGLLAIGDAASFIDPFTGSGMLMALESGEVVAETIAAHLRFLRGAQTVELLAKEYEGEYTKRFDSRLRVSGMLRRAAFVPYLAETAIMFFGSSTRLRRKLAHATRHANSGEARASLS